MFVSTFPRSRTGKDAGALKLRIGKTGKRHPCQVRINSIFCLQMENASDRGKLALMSNGLPGKMAMEVAQAALRRGLDLVPYSLTGERTQERVVECAVREDGVRAGRTVRVELVRPSERDRLASTLVKQFPSIICVDFTHPSAVLPNASWYVGTGLDFVMGTTGGDAAALHRLVADSDRYAVIAPNMAKQIVAFQALVDMLGRKFPGAFRGYRLEVIESHQASKADTSGTAKAVVASMLQRWGVTGLESEQDIQKVRDQSQQRTLMGVPEAFLDGHAFHTYRLTSPDGSVQFVFQHNVCGRRVYADGTIDAVLFLDRQRRVGANQKIYDMIDVLRMGGML